MSKKPWPILYSSVQYKIGQDFWRIQYIICTIHLMWNNFHIWSCKKGWTIELVASNSSSNPDPEANDWNPEPQDCTYIQGVFSEKQYFDRIIIFDYWYRNDVEIIIFHCMYTTRNPCWLVEVLQPDQVLRQEDGSVLDQDAALLAQAHPLHRPLLGLRGTLYRRWYT